MTGMKKSKVPRKLKKRFKRNMLIMGNGFVLVNGSPDDNINKKANEYIVNNLLASLVR